MRVRKKIAGSTARPRLSVFKSARHFYAQIIDDASGSTLVSASTLSKELKGAKADKAGAVKVGSLLAERALSKGIKNVVFDRNGFIYHGSIKALADAAREKGLVL